MEVLRLGVESELQLQAYATATTTTDPTYTVARQTLNPLNEARDGSCILMDPSRVR